MRKALVIVIIGVGIPGLMFSGIFEGKTGTHIGQKATDNIGFWGASPVPKQIIAGTPSAANLESALAKAGLVATATPTATATATATATPTPTPGGE
jgi:hypothetical protein